MWAIWFEIHYHCLPLYSSTNCSGAKISLLLRWGSEYYVTSCYMHNGLTFFAFVLQCLREFMSLKQSTSLSNLSLILTAAKLILQARTDLNDDLSDHSFFKVLMLIFCRLILNCEFSTCPFGLFWTLLNLVKFSALPFLLEAYYADNTGHIVMHWAGIA